MKCEHKPGSSESSLAQLADEAAAGFQKRFGRAPRWVAAAPGRVNLIGEHTDYNDGFVLPMAIERWTILAGAPGSARELTVCSSALDGQARIDLTKSIERAEPAWANYVRGVAARFQEIGLEIPGLELLVHSNVPLGGGLSSSAALEVATATLLEAATEHTLDPVAKAVLCQQAEHKFAGVPCGIMDQFTSVLARANHFLLLDCRSQQTELIPMIDQTVAVLIINTNVKHELAAGAYAQRRRQCETAARQMKVAALRDATLDSLYAAQAQLDPVVLRRARHVITENERTVAAARALQDADWARLGELMFASHTSLRDDYEVSCLELDVLVELAQAMSPANGLIGCRMTGGGFGGCVVALARTDALEEIEGRMALGYRERTGREASMFISRPANGAHLVD
jgi:galactokinase